MTMTGSAAGSPDYMPREQVTDFRDVKPASDVFSMGASYYHMLTGVPPRGKLAGQDPIVAVLQVPVIPILDVESKVPKPVAAVIMRALKPKAADRYPSAAEFRDALKKALAP
jgi:serine/threonine-protein kinase